MCAWMNRQSKPIEFPQIGEAPALVCSDRKAIVARSASPTSMLEAREASVKPLSP